MASKIPYKLLVRSFLSISLGLFVCSLPTLTLAKSIFKAPARGGLPGRREPAGVRGQCLDAKLVPNLPPLPANQTYAFPKNYRTLAALTPAPDRSIGQTVSGYPTFFWHQPPFKPDYAKTVEFILYEWRGPRNVKVVYKTLLPIGDQSGVMSFKLPEKPGVAPLQVGKVYRWSINVICDLNDRTAEDAADGFIERVNFAPDLQSKLKKTSVAEVPAIYAAAGIWHEALTTLAALRRSKPNDPNLAALWSDLLEGIDLKKLAQEPLVDCCTVSSIKPKGMEE
ncbi:DUF928 domain-containing protein [Leptolyngbya sp. 'hensonii']|uniref:DUF928 domain-containing protein n=1 Tax=Leptolyngbya sp. 'hensonii' TaxID=1922337 RepID=UPI000A78A14B|nr:DUF928 domain-containing protein [Leptolyngbya sp. 'hensonii']